MKSSILKTLRKLRGIYFIDPEDKEFKETIKNARKKLETSVAPAMRCKIMKKNCGSGGSNKVKTKLACILEADESTRLRMGNFQYRIIMKTILQEKETIHCSTTIWYTNLFPMPQAVKIPLNKDLQHLNEHGYHLQSARLRWTSSRHSIS